VPPVIPETLDAALGERLAEYATGPRTEQVETALDALGSGGGSLRRFFEIYRGSFCGSAISYSLLDLTEQEMFPEFLNWYFLGKRDDRSRAPGTAPS
jgi:hypothetical protein